MRLVDQLERGRQERRGEWHDNHAGGEEHRDETVARRERERGD